VGTTIFSLALAFAAVALNPPDVAIADYVDVIEINHYYDEQGKLVFDQLLFFEWSPAESCYHLRAWRLVKTRSHIPQKDWVRGDYVATFHDGDSLRTVRAKVLRETWTQYDPELIERERLPKERRRELVSRDGTRRATRLAIATPTLPVAPSATITTASAAPEATTLR